MRVDAAASYLYTHTLRAAPRAQEVAAARTVEATQATAAAQEAQAPREDGARQVDFSHMTLKEMLGWIHEQYLQGEMTWEESGDFSLWAIGCGMRYDEVTGRIWHIGEDVEFDFTQAVREGVAFARSHEYGDGGRHVRAMEAGWAAMLRYQGQQMSVDVLA